MAKGKVRKVIRFKGKNIILASAVVFISILVLTMGLLVMSFAAEDAEDTGSSENVRPEGVASVFAVPAEEDAFKGIAKTMKKNSRGVIKKNMVAAASSGQDPEDTLRMRQEAARFAAVDWAITIAEDDSFHYGESKWAHHNGCYFCGTNQKENSLKRKDGAGFEESERTYCCNPFVTAAFVHGAGATEMDCRVASKRLGLSRDSNKVLKNKDAFEKITKPASAEQLEVGDILLTPTHAMLYIGSGAVAEAAHHDDGVQNDYWNDSIRCKPISSRQWNRVELIYRYIGTGAY